LKKINLAFGEKRLATQESILQLLMDSLNSVKSGSGSPTLLGHSNSKSLALHALQNIYNDDNDVYYEINESGFIRVSFPAPPHLKEFSARIRLNYWPRSVNKHMLSEAESIHTHPQYFESIVISGSYTHDVYQLVSMGTKFQNYIKNKKENSVRQYQDVYLNKVKRETITQGTVLGMPRSTIHKVVAASPKTLTINVVYPKVEEDLKFNIFLSKEGKPSDIKNVRTKVEHEKRMECLNDISNILTNFILDMSK